jgi:hypothetical protein
MSKAISTEAIFTRFSSRADGSIGFGGVTPELVTEAKIALIDLHGRNVKLLIQPMDGVPDEIVLVKTDIEQRTPSERLRAVLFVQFKQTSGPPITFDQFYKIAMERIIEAEKAKLEPNS